MTTLFISDLHLDSERPEITRLFLDFLQTEARGARALYILGDLFEAWVGDDDPSEVGHLVATGVRAVVDAGVPVAFIRGNRDFLLGEEYARRCGMRVLSDPAVVTLDGTPTLLMHGDLLCTDDLAYQRFRAQTRDPAWQSAFLSQPLAARIAFAQQARDASRAHQAGLATSGAMESITDVAPDAVLALFQRYGVSRLVHGHTHRPATHALDVAGRRCERIVLGDWYEQGSVLRVDGARSELTALQGAARVPRADMDANAPI